MNWRFWPRLKKPKVEEVKPEPYHSPEYRCYMCTKEISESQRDFYHGLCPYCHFALRVNNRQLSNVPKGKPKIEREKVQFD